MNSNLANCSPNVLPWLEEATISPFPESGYGYEKKKEKDQIITEYVFPSI